MTFAGRYGGGTITGGSQTSDANGMATVGNWTMGATPGTNSLTATVTGLPPVSFVASAIGTEFALVVATWGHTCGLNASGIVFCWGRNTWGQLGNGTTTDRLAPTAVVRGMSFTTLRGTDHHTCGVAGNGSAYC